jgi:hypothetical protein
MASAADQQQVEADLTAASSRMQLLAAELDLRRRALQGEIKADDIAPSLRRTELTLQLRQLVQELDLASARLGEARKRQAVGAGSELDVKQAEILILERQLEMKKLQQQLQTLGAKKE